MVDDFKFLNDENEPFKETPEEEIYSKPKEEIYSKINKKFSSSKKNKKNLYKTLLYWGIPLIIIFILSLVLIIEMTTNEAKDIKYQENDFQEDTITTPSFIEKTRNPNEEHETEILDEKKSTNESQEPSSRIEENNTTLPEPSSNEAIKERNIAIENNNSREDLKDSYIVEEGDSLWTIAKNIKNNQRNGYEWKTIMVQNKDKIDYTIISEDTGKWKVMIEKGRKLKIQLNESKKRKHSFIQRGKKSYALQVISLNDNQLLLGINLVRTLIKDGYYAYLYRTKNPIQRTSNSIPKHYYRIRVGFFDSEEEAQHAGEIIYNRYKVRRIFPADFWPVLPSYSELNGELIDFGIQKSHPWVIQISQHNSRQEAIDDFKKVITLADFAYISQKRTNTNTYIFRTRIGFFEEQIDAKKFLYKIKQHYKNDFPEAKIIEIKQVMEAAPGQNTGSISQRFITQ